MNVRPSPAMLAPILLVDAAASGFMGGLLAAFAGPLSRLLGLPAQLLAWAGIGLLVFAAALVIVALRGHRYRVAVSGVVLINILWVLASVLLLLSAATQPTAIGTAVVLVQAAAVAVFAWLEAGTLRA